jgi:hypothetical protein
MKKPPLIETQITKQIRQLLFHCGALSIKIAGGPYQKPGISDLLVCLPRNGVGVFVAIEVKRPGHTLTPLQDGFLREVRAAGGIAFVAYSVEDVVRELDLRVKVYPLFHGGKPHDETKGATDRD